MGTYTFSVELDVADPAPDFNPNCDCDCGYPTKTREEMRSEVAIAMGYAAQLAALPASFEQKVNYQLNLHQRMAAQDIVEINAVRYFSWDVEQGQTKFCTTDNLETCRNVLAATRITEAYIVTDDNVITRLVKGIEYQRYEAGNPASTPSHYEVRSCIEIWPPPDRAMKLVVKGSLAAVDMTADTDTPTVDPDLVVLRTIAFMKAGKGHQDAQLYMGQYRSFIAGLNAEGHTDERYVPGKLRWDRVRDERLTHLMEPRIYGGTD